MNSLNNRNAKSFAVLVAVLGLLATSAYAQTSLTNGVAVTGISGSAGSEKFYKIEVPAGQDELVISTSGGTGDVDLYVRRGSQPTTSSYDYRPYKVGNNETVTVANPTAGTWYILLKGYNVYSGVTLLAQYSAAISITPLVNGVPVTSIGGSAGGEVYFSIEVPASQTKLEISMSGGTGDADLYVKKGALPTTSSYDYRPYLIGNNESVTVNNPDATTWYVMIRGYNAFSGITLLATYGGGVGTQLENGVPVTGISGAQASEKIYRIDVPAGQTSLEIQITGGTGDADLYVKLGAPPTTTDYDYRPFLAGSEESVTINTPLGGTWYIMVRGYSAFTGLTLKASYGDVRQLQDGVPVTGLSGALNSLTYYKIVVPSGQDVLLVSMSGGTGNADLYIKKGSKPTTSSWDYRPIQSGNTESVSIGASSLPGTWYIMIRGTAAYSGVTLLADYSASTATITLVNGVAVKDISGSQGGAKYYKIEVPSGQSKLEIVMSGGTGDADLYVKRGEIPTTAEYDYRPYLPGNDESVTVNNPAAGTWYIMIRGYQAFSGVTLLATYGGGTVPDTVTTLQNGVAVTGQTGSAGGEAFYKITVPAGQAKLEIAMSGGTGDADMYVRKGSKPSTTEWDYRPYQIGNNETVTIDNPTAATYYIMLRGYVAYTGVSLKATYTPVVEEVIALQNGVAVTGLSGASGGEAYYKIEVPTGQDTLRIEMSGGTGDADLYVRKGSKPTLTSWDYRPYLIGNNETVEVASPAAATWYIMLRGYQAYTGVTLKATYEVAKKGNDFTKDLNAVAVWEFEADKLAIDSLKSLTLENSGVIADTVNFKQGASSARFTSGAQWYLEDYAFYGADASLPANFPGKNGTANKTFSISLWTYFDYPANQAEFPLVTKCNTSGGMATYELSLIDTNQIVLRIGTGTGYTKETLTHASTLVTGRWYHIVATFNDATHTGTISVWDNTTGALVGTDAQKTNFSAINLSSAAFMIGGVDNLWWQTTNGLMDEVAIFNDVLTTAEIAKIRAGTYGK
jgi:hypothetical protein